MTYANSSAVSSNIGQNGREALLARILSPSPVFTLHGRHDDERQQVEDFVANRFRKDYCAEIHEFMPDLLSMRCLNTFSGVIGMRRAAGSALFLEQYLDGDIESVLSAASGHDIARRDIVEIGNLVAGRKGPSQFVFLVATSLLFDAGVRWITFTATQTLANNLEKLGFPMIKLADASSEYLPESEAGEWGSYYQTRPCVFAGSLEGAMEIARRRPLFRKALAMYRKQIMELAREFEG